MEILSVGQKIKRARIYKGYTLKQICKDKFSVSKMSCIENDKINAEDWILKHIADMLDLDLKYLTQDVKEQLTLRLKELKLNKNQREYEEKLKYDLRVAVEHRYYNIGLEIMHLLFAYYMDEGEVLKCKDYVYLYYEMFTHVDDKEINFLYYLDIANIAYHEKEYLQASNYYKNVRNYIKDEHINNKEYLAQITYYEISCHINLKEFECAHELVDGLLDLLKNIKDNTIKAKIYRVAAVIELNKENNEDKFKELEKKSYELLGDNIELKARFMYKYSIAFFEKGFKDKALEYIENAIDIYSNHHDRKIVKFILLNVEILIQNGMYEKANVLCEKALNHAIKLDDNKLVEKIYYYKAIMFQREDKLMSTEMYMNLSLDLLLKFGSKSEIYKRYLEIGKMYYKLDNVKEAIKYFTLAINLKEKL